MILNSEQLGAIEPRQVSAWLRSNDWVLTKTLSNHSAVYTKESEEGTYEVTVPLHLDFRDYNRRIRELLETLSISCNRAVAWIFEEITGSTSDIIRLRASGPNIGPGKVSVELGTRLFSQTKELLLAGACAAIEPKQVYPSRKPAEVIDFLRKVTIAAPDVGSFVITVYAPVPPSLIVPMFESSEELPFERRATLMLARSVASVCLAAETAMLQGNADAFVKDASYGISANLCEALAGYMVTGETSVVEIDFAWALSRPVPKDVRSKLVLRKDLAPVLLEGAKVLRDHTPQPDFRIDGAVIQLTSSAPEQGGSVIIAGQVDGKTRKIRIEMGADDYQEAIRAHKDHLFLQCEGDLLRKGTQFCLNRIRNVYVIQDQD